MWATIVERHSLRLVPSTVWWLGVFGFLTGASSVVYVTLTPLFLRHQLSIDIQTMGIIGGIAESVAMISRAIIGILSDRWGTRKAFLMVGGFLYLLGRGLLVVPSNVYTVSLARFLDRIGNGIQASPRDALVGQITPDSVKGVGYGFRMGVTFAGPVFGALCAVPFLREETIPFQQIFLYATFPVIFALVILHYCVEDQRFSSRPVQFFTHLQRFSSTCWKIVGLNTLFQLLNFCGSFVVIMVEQYQSSWQMTFWIMVVQNSTAALVSLCFGHWIQRHSAMRVLLTVSALGFLTNGVLMHSLNLTTAFVGIGFFGLYLGFVQTVFAILMAKHTSKESLGTGFGILHFSSGIAVLLTNTIMGMIWSHTMGGPGAAFGLNALLALLNGVFVVIFARRL